MCGFAALFGLESLGGPEGANRRMEAMLGALAHRGPDGEGVFCDGEWTVLGHRRLSIVDRTEAAAQPFRDALSGDVLVFTGEEVWQTRFPDAESVHFSDWPEVDAGWVNETFAVNWAIVRAARERVNGMIEPLRRDKELGTSLQANVHLAVADKDALSLLTSLDLSELFISADVTLNFGKAGGDMFSIAVSPTQEKKCGRCWRHLPEVVEDGALCGRCADVVGG